MSLYVITTSFLGLYKSYQHLFYQILLVLTFFIHVFLIFIIIQLVRTNLFQFRVIIILVITFIDIMEGSMDIKVLIKDNMEDIIMDIMGFRNKVPMDNIRVDTKLDIMEFINMGLVVDKMVKDNSFPFMVIKFIMEELIKQVIVILAFYLYSYQLNLVDLSLISLINHQLTYYLTF